MSILQSRANQLEPHPWEEAATTTQPGTSQLAPRSGRQSVQPAPPITVPQRRGARFLTWLFALSGFLAFIAWLDRRVFRHYTEPLWAEVATVANIPLTSSAVSAVGLLILAVGLSRHKRIALLAVIALQVVGGLWAVLDLLYLWQVIPSVPRERPESVPYLIASVVIAVVSVPLLVRLLPAFPARVPRGSWWAAVAVLLGGLGLAAAATQLFVLVSDEDTGPAWQQTLIALLHAVGLRTPGGWQHVEVGRLVPQVNAVIIGAALLVAVWIFLRSARWRDSWTGTNELAVRRLLAEYGDDDSLGYFNTRRDKLLHFSDNQRAAIAYRVINGVCLASGDPIGAPTSWPDAIASWEANARVYGWIPAVMACGQPGARAYASVLGFDILRLGDEAILTPSRFKINSTSLTEVRRAVRRARSEGLWTRIRPAGELSAEEGAELARLADQWRAGETERGFSMALGRFPDPADGRVVVVEVLDASDRLVALQTFVPWGRRGLSLDLMRRSPDAPNGTNEFLTAELMAWAEEHGIARISLNFAFLRRVFAEAEQVGASTVVRAGSRVLGAFDRFWQIQRLYRANAKYNPAWQPRFIALPGTLNVLQVAVACSAAEGFIPDLSPRTGDESRELTASELAEVHQIDTPRPPTDDWAKRAGDQTRQRLRHLAELEASGRPGYPVGRRQAVRLSALTDPLAQADGRGVVGRVRRIRDLGGVCFVDLVDAGAGVQLVVDADLIGRDQVREFSRLVDSGDLVEVTATAGRSRSGTPSLLVSGWQMLAKSLRPVPWQGLDDPEVRLRERSLDLVVHPDRLDLLNIRSRVIRAVRETLVGQGFEEVETPILGLTNGGAVAKPFRTHIDAYDTDLVLRIAPELALKRLLVGGMGAIFELGRNFRNEGADNTHNPEFTVVEAYAPFADYTDMRILTQRMIQAAAIAVHGRPVMPIITDGSPVVLDISGDWPVVPACQAVSDAIGQRIGIDTDLDELLRLAQAYEIDVRNEWGAGSIIEALYDHLVEPTTVNPTFYSDFPAETSPLTAPHRSQPGLAERWDLVVGGMELGTAYSELTDPRTQRQRLTEQSWKAALGDPEAMEIDEFFLRSLELGMPPTGGLGIGTDRLVMALTGTTIRQVLAFPFVRPQ
ncbi:MAG: bifunctional lysylphosphatidylglycerol synthetase/lysine--tRNA ligase LysX [Brooklawnia sp.]|uniref:bifunctional lysylphosphatidylglycerol synthetase/lysine--tRNA ligase LysX n=1 Tax=Brooklawnia sp. TaxID=2699740 RepID=UPI003C78936C